MHQKLHELIPTCHICQKPVDEFTQEDVCDRDASRFIAKCHGDIDIEFINQSILRKLTKITPGIAFRKRKDIENA